MAELGCGTGRYAEMLFKGHLPASATYWGCDISATMLDLARQRLRPYGDRVTIWKSDGEGQLPLPDASVDHFVSNYVFDLLPIDQIRAMLAEARRILKPDGLICLVSITNGEKGLSKGIMKLWKFVFDLRPSLVGGCRPILLPPMVEQAQFEIQHQRVLIASGISSEVVVARKKDNNPAG